MPDYGTGFFRMMARLGSKKAEALRQDTLRLQREMREKVSGERGTERDRDHYTEYPPPKPRRKK